MKQIRILIISFIVAAALFACEEKNVFPDPMTLPVKALDLDIEVNDIFALPDGRTVSFVKIDKQSTDTTDAYVLAFIDKNGNYTQSDVMFFLKLDEKQTAEKVIRIASSGEIFVNFQVNEIAYSNIVKLDKNGHIIYSKDDKGINRISEQSYTYHLYAMYDNGEIADFQSNIFDYEGKPNAYYSLYTIDNQGNQKNIKYTIDNDYYWTNVIAFDDKFLLYNSTYAINGYYFDYNINLESPGFAYSIITADGTTVKTGEFDFPIFSLKYMDEFIYIISLTGIVETEEGDPFVAKWCITKMDTSGEIIVTSDTIEASFLFSNFTVSDGNLIIPGGVVTDEDNDDGFGVIYLFNDNTGELKDSIAMRYNNLDAIPCVISPDSKGEYDIFALVRHDYDDWNDFKNGGNMEKGKLFIYHTDDLHKLNVNN